MTLTRLSVVGILAFLSMAFAMAQPLEGTRWKIKLVPDEEARKAGAKEIEDTITFKGSKFTSETFAKQGFAAVEYEEDSRGLISALFKAQAKSDTAGTAKWEGTVVSDQIKGQLVIVGKDGKERTYSYQGEKLRN